MTVRALLFDLDETLIVEPESVNAAMLAACALATGIAPGDLGQAVLKRGKELWHAAPTGSYCRSVGISSWEGLHGDFSGDDPHLKALAAWVPSFRKAVWSSALAEFGVTNAVLASQLDERFRLERRERHVKYPDTEETLARLRPRYKFGLVTNGAPRVQREKVECAGLAPFFDTVVVSGDIGIGKPDVRVFKRALELLKVEPREAVMIGNNLEKDIAGASAAGIPSIWIDREGREGTPAGGRRITSLSEV